MGPPITPSYTITTVILSECSYCVDDNPNGVNDYIRFNWEV